MTSSIEYSSDFRYSESLYYNHPDPVVEYSSDFSYSESLYYSHPDFLIEVTPDPVDPPDPVVIDDPPASGVSGGSQPIGEFVADWPYLTPEQMLIWLKKVNKKIIKVKVKIKINNKEHLSFTEEIAVSDHNDVKNIVLKTKNITEKVLDKPKNIIVRFNKVEKVS